MITVTNCYDFMIAYDYAHARAWLSFVFFFVFA